MGVIPADSLENRDLGNGWAVKEKITRNKFSTGGHFSVGYTVLNSNGKAAFLKAFDFSSATEDSDPLKKLQGMLEDYNHERDLLEKCKGKKLDRIMTPILDGFIRIDGFGFLGNVHYLIFEKAAGDIRDIFNEFDKFDLIWVLKSLHHVAVGLSQLHGIGIAHQDLKPSNVLFSELQGSKISDLGRASDFNKFAPIDNCLVPCDKGYAPLDLWYLDTGIEGFQKRLLTDLYLLGSLFFFYFTKVSAVSALRDKLKGERLGNHSFKEDLPIIQRAFEESLVDLKKEINLVTGDLTSV